MNIEKKVKGIGDLGLGTRKNNPFRDLNLRHLIFGIRCCYDGWKQKARINNDKTNSFENKTILSASIAANYMA